MSSTRWSFSSSSLAELRDRAALDHEGAVRVGFAELEVGVEQHRRLGGRGDKARRDQGPGSVAECKRGARRTRDLEISACDMRQRNS
jgi:hypothetical protein